MKPIPVYQLNNYLGRILSTDPLLGNLSVIGEVSNLKFHQTGNVFFSLKDSRSKVDCFIGAQNVPNLSAELKEGAMVICHGYVRVYEPRGTYSLNVRDVEMQGIGELTLAFEQMKQKLDKEGLFDLDHKKPLPDFPKSVGVVTASTGAAIRDIVRIISDRNDYVDIYVFPVTVQGERAAPSIAGAIDYANREYPFLDVLIVGRGGGSIEDLWAFNEEQVARSVYASEIPIISGVGHEIDVTICDLVADLRAATPTDAANQAVPDTHELRRQLAEIGEDLSRRMTWRVEQARKRLDSMDMKLQKSLMEQRVASARRQIEDLKDKLEALHPDNIVERGYAMITDGDGKVLTGVSQMNPGDRIRIRTKDGEAGATVDEITRRES